MPETPHDRKIVELAGIYRGRGYNVLENPSPAELPPFLHGHQPDLIATSPADNVVIEVKGRAVETGSALTIDTIRRLESRRQERMNES
jgi:Holliday junction resolvase